MAKMVKDERLVIMLELTRNKDTSKINIHANANYEVSSDDLTVARNIEPTINAKEKKAIKSFGASVLQQIKAIEEE